MLATLKFTPEQICELLSKEIEKLGVKATSPPMPRYHNTQFEETEFDGYEIIVELEKKSD